MNPLEQLSLADLRARRSAKWARYEPDVIPMWVAEMDVPLAEPILTALQEALTIGDTGYPGSWPMVDEFVAFAARHWGWQVEPSLVVPAASVISAYVEAFVEDVAPGEEVVITAPVYPPFTTYLHQAGRVVREAPLTDDLRLDLDALETALAAATAPADGSTERRKAGLLLCNPHNPGGTVHTREELTAVASLANRYGVTVVSDEIHAPLVYSGAEFTPYLSVPGGETGIAVQSASKAFSLAAMPAAQMIVGTERAAWLGEFRKGAHGHPTYLGSIASTVAYRDGDAWLASLLVGLEANRDTLRAFVAERLPGVTVSRNAGTYLAWLDFGGTVAAGGRDLGGEPADVLLAEGRVALNQGTHFGVGGAGHARLNFATPPAVLAEGLERIASVVVAK
ncbi:aminotransferase class I/II-fold pyridoxal phosphate-dependent enzyme [Demequina capsici]|uniref:cysteine-S-conjugate beta-lyase n=1 Tax=Demequina capsici TaxID=3075620 RepID=A0AA96JCZ8_9MICO|nr:aminotransferase class I/II-fold pyridoxal phosphate-dependent enzyme [Demequina sp. PMTSA13]WNM27481.1 aminotransferase class I/II-fold pyridoxal phosphate-dependent enzyme [Demequina sp. PMTSA13]